MVCLMDKVLEATLAETKKKNFVKKKQVYVKDVGDEFKFFCLENNILSLIEDKIHFVPFSGSFETYQCGKYCEIEIGVCRRINVFVR